MASTSVMAMKYTTVLVSPTVLGLLFQVVYTLCNDLLGYQVVLEIYMEIWGFFVLSYTRCILKALSVDMKFVESLRNYTLDDP